VMGAHVIVQRSDLTASAAVGTFVDAFTGGRLRASPWKTSTISFPTDKRSAVEAQGLHGALSWPALGGTN